MKKQLTATLGLMVFLAVVAAAQTDVTGTWNLTVNTDQGTNAATLTLKQDGETVMGTLEGDQGGFDLEGKIMGNELEFVAEVDAGGQFIEITMKGTVDGDEITGSLDFGGYGGGDWTAARAQ